MNFTLSTPTPFIFLSPHTHPLLLQEFIEGVDVGVGQFKALDLGLSPPAHLHSHYHTTEGSSPASAMAAHPVPLPARVTLMTLRLSCAAQSRCRAVVGV